MENSAKKISAQMLSMISQNDEIGHHFDDSDEDIKEEVKVFKTEFIPEYEETKSKFRNKKLNKANNVKKPRRLYCVECKAVFYTMKALRRHCSDNHPVKNTEGRACECCFEKFNTFKSALAHRKRHYRPYVCEDCWEGFDTNEDLSSHKCPKAEKPEKPEKKAATQCDQCGKSYQASYIRIHMLTHKEERTYSCKQCPKKFKVFKGLHSHVQWAHKRIKKHKCEYCNAMFLSSSARCTHVRKIHLGEKKHVCECGKAYFSRSDLDRHVLTHTGEKNFHCHLCDKSYQRRHCLNVHLKTHSQMTMNVMDL